MNHDQFPQIKISNALHQRMADSFAIYDFTGNHMVETINIPIVLRFLGCSPTDQDTKDFIAQSELSYAKGFVHLSQFIAVLSNWLLVGRMKPATITDLINAFALLDPHRRCCIDAEEFLEMMRRYDAVTFSEDEEQQMIAAAICRPDNVCYYEQYIIKLLYEPSDCIYKMATEFEADLRAV